MHGHMFTVITCLLCGVVAGISAAAAPGWIMPVLFVAGGLLVGAIFEWLAHLIACVMQNLNRTDFYLLMLFCFMRFGAVACVQLLGGALARSLAAS